MGVESCFETAAYGMCAQMARRREPRTNARAYACSVSALRTCQASQRAVQTEGIFVGCAAVQALVEQSGPEKWIVAFSRDALPRDAAGRFGALFAQRARWEWCDHLRPG